MPPTLHALPLVALLSILLVPHVQVVIQHVRHVMDQLVPTVLHVLLVLHTGDHLPKLPALALADPINT